MNEKHRFFFPDYLRTFFLPSENKTRLTGPGPSLKDLNKMETGLMNETQMEITRKKTETEKQR